MLPAAPAAPDDALADVIPVVPTSERSFLRVDRVSAFFRVYQGGTSAPGPVRLDTRITDAQDQVVFDLPQTLEPDRFATARSTDVTFALPLVRLVPGDYLLTFEAAVGTTTVRRDVQINVR